MEKEYLIVVVDDSEINLKIAETILAKQYRVETFQTGRDYLHFLQTHIPDLVLVDIHMPDLDGFEIMRLMQDSDAWAQIPVIFLTPDSEHEAEVKGFQMGALDFITKPFVAECAMQRISRVLELTKLQNQLESEVKKQTAVAEERRIRVETMALETIHTLATTIDAKDTYTNGHSSRVADYSVALARELGWDENRCTKLHRAAVLHDIGKIGVPDRVLNKPGKLTDEEYNIIKSHTVVGSDILKKSIELENAEIVARHHHERYDGKGYPDHLAGETIPIEARIVGVADSYDAMNSRRVYRRPLPKDIIREELVKGSGFQFDPICVAAFLRLFDNGKLDEMNQVFFTEPIELDNRSEKAKMTKDRDALTGLKLRTDGEKMISEAIAGTAGYLMILDVDHMKRVNETGGHTMGDQVLTDLTEILKRSVSGDLLFRLGGDEFLCFLPDYREDQIIQLAESIQTQFELCKKKYADCSFVGISMGISPSTQDDNYEHAYSRADKALYHVKQMGVSNYYLYQSDRQRRLHPADIDLQKLVQSLHDEAIGSGAMEIQCSDFPRMFEYVGNLRKRYQHDFHLAMVTLENQMEETQFIEDIDGAMSCMEYAIHQNIRNVDICTRYSSVQFLIILMEVGSDSVDQVMDRIFADFYKKCGETKMRPSYSVAVI